MTRRSLLIAALVLLAVLVGMVVWMALKPSEVERHLARLRAEGIPTTPLELDAWYAAVPDAENAGALFLEAASGFRTVSAPGLELEFTRRLSLTNVPSDEVQVLNRAYLATNAGTLAAIHAALQHPHSRYPVDFRGGVHTQLPHLDALKTNAEQLGVCAEIAAESGEPELATRCLLDSMRLARTLEQEPMLISFLVATVCDAIAVTSTARVLRHVALSEDELVSLQRALGESAARLTYGRAMMGEVCMTRDALRNPAQVLFKSPWPTGSSRPGFDIQEIGLWLYSAIGVKSRDLSVMVDYYDRSRICAALSPTQRRLETQTLNAEVTRRLASEFLPLARMMLPALFQVETKATRQASRLRCAEVACAVQRWRLAHAGALPPSLDALVPELLTSVPEDPMDGRPLRFRALAKGFVVYSVGEDGLDDGGTVHLPGVSKRWDDTFVVER